MTMLSGQRESAIGCKHSYGNDIAITASKLLNRTLLYLSSGVGCAGVIQR